MSSKLSYSVAVGEGGCSVITLKCSNYQGEPTPGILMELHNVLSSSYAPRRCRIERLTEVGKRYPEAAAVIHSLGRTVALRNLECSEFGEPGLYGGHSFQVIMPEGGQNYSGSEIDNSC
jgi:hypothetical protein